MSNLHVLLFLRMILELGLPRALSSPQSSFPLLPSWYPDTPPVSGAVHGPGDGPDPLTASPRSGGLLPDGDGSSFMPRGVLFWRGISRFWSAPSFCGKSLKFGIWPEVGTRSSVVVVVTSGDCVLPFNSRGMTSFIDPSKMGLVRPREAPGIRRGPRASPCFPGTVPLTSPKKPGLEFSLNFCCSDFRFKISPLNSLPNRAMSHLNFGSASLFTEISEYVLLLVHNEQGDSCCSVLQWPTRLRLQHQGKPTGSELWRHVCLIHQILSKLRVFRDQAFVSATCQHCFCT